MFGDLIEGWRLAMTGGCFCLLKLHHKHVMI